jgi:hypothetical protein
MAVLCLLDGSLFLGDVVGRCLMLVGQGGFTTYLYYGALDRHPCRYAVLSVETIDGRCSNHLKLDPLRISWSRFIDWTVFLELIPAQKLNHIKHWTQPR